MFWYRRRDSNPHQLVSKTSASARLGHAGTFQIANFELRIARNQFSIVHLSILDSQRRRQESNLHRNSPGGLARRCHTIRRRLPRRELRIEDRGSNDETRSRSSILNPLSSILWRRVRDSNSHRPKPAGFRDRCTASYANPPRSRSRRSRTSINGFGDRHAAGYTMLPW